ncbi:tRNA epoxyqueuosine(34) reductase QueG [uncultured Bacteroides sp.]|uniref:tRNA epoxyqueuosine(34) reductase QueG n=1 Tax=uncultured Bacteroides sp. TaxID=162156 RepID=UPI0025DE84EE|nr:tRNA epoxyqueuosine(34) reductase QueG [uncultured Bacteroides sp.]
MKKYLLSSENIKAEALRLGFSACGLAPAEAVSGTVASAFRQWIADGCQAEMAYMQNYEEKRLNPCLLVEGAQTVVSVAMNYYPDKIIPENEYQIAWYAYGKDYHDVMKAKLNDLLEFIRKELLSETDLEDINARIFCDTAPVLERYWAWRAGLGWIGKNTQLIIPQAGSCFFLGEIIIGAAADSYDTPQKSRCGSCTRCLNVCPTKALEAPFRLISAKCLSYLTIEHRGELPPDTGKKMGNKIYGCDECQRACPWNRFASPTKVTEFHPSPRLVDMQKQDWHQLTEEQYKVLFKGSAVKRAKYQGLVRNIKAAKDS